MIDANDRLKFLSGVLGTGYLGKDGLNASFKCPKCSNSEKFKFVIKLDDEKWHCWVCGLKGRKISSLLKRFSKESVRKWIELFGTVEQKKYIDDPQEEEEKLDLPENFVPLIANNYDPDYKAVLKYLENRGIDEQKIWRYRIGTSTRGKCRRRAVITSYDFEGNLNYWTARAISSDATVKYVNPRVERRDVIFNEIDIDWTKELTIVEGPFDLMSIGGNSTCLLGSSLSNSHALFQRIVGNQTPVVLALDKDVRKKAHEIAKLLFTHDIQIKFLDTGEYNDVGEMPEEELLKAKEKATYWNPNDRLFHLIRNISSGSMF
jgi:DNA primase